MAWEWPERAKSARLTITGRGVTAEKVYGKGDAFPMWNPPVPEDFNEDDVFTAKLTFYNGERGGGEEEIGRVSPRALSGDTVIDGDGEKHIVLTPSKDAALKSRGRIDRFKVALSSEAVADEELLYIVFDLSKEAGSRGARQYVTRNALTNGVWGAWAETPADGAIWTGLADDERYFRELMAFRRVLRPASAGRALPHARAARDLRDVQLPWRERGGAHEHRRGADGGEGQRR